MDAVMKQFIFISSGSMDLIKYILTCNPKTKRDSVIGEYIGQIKSLYPPVGKVETMFKEFHSLLMGNSEKNWMNIWKSMGQAK